MKRTFAVLAVLLVLLRPVCDALAAESVHAVQGGGNETPCCADIEDGTLAKVSEKVGTPGGPEAMLAAPVLFAVLQPAAPGTGTRDPTVLPRTSASFYVRSARIRR